MYLSNCFCISVLVMIADGFTLHGPSGPLVAPLGSSVVLPCSVDKPLPLEDLEVEWRRTDSDILVHLFQDGESRAESQHQDYQYRAHFFTKEIQRGNFSHRLDNLRAKDEGEYTCTVYSQQESGETVVEIKDVERLLVSGSDQSISASVGEDITLSCSVDSHIQPEDLEEVSWKKTDKDENILVLVFQNNETLSDSSNERYRDRVEFFTDETPKGNFSLRLKSVRTECCDKGVYMCQVFAGDLSANTTIIVEQMGFSVSHIMMMILCIAASGSALLLCCLIYCRSHNDVLATFCGRIGERISDIFDVLAELSFDILPSLQFILLFYAFGSASGGFFIVAILPVLTTVTNYNWDKTCGIKMGCSPLVRRSVWLMLMLLMNAAMVYFYIMALEIVLVLLNAGVLMAELILKTGIPKITTCLQTCQNAARNNQTTDSRSQQDQSPQTAAGSDEPPAAGSNQNTESHEMKHLMKTEDQEAETNGETQPDPNSVKSQT
ncbi:uncharacterized protein [Garra rufa]|uniref:uncharacterized protein n=1 Tax=Garra rufa TaxID=137080 RepID=UPI003CCE854D